MLVAIASGYLIAALAPLLVRVLRSAAAPMLAVVPAFQLAWFLQFVPDAAEGRGWHFAFPWGGPGGLEAVFRLDALSLFFAAIATLLASASFLAMGALKLSSQARGRLFLAMLSLMSSALGFILADTPALISGFSVLATLSMFLLLTARRGAVGRARRTPLLMALVVGDLMLIAALVGLFVGSDAMTLSALTAHPLSATTVARVAAVLFVVSGLTRFIIVPADLRASGAGMMNEAAVLLAQCAAYVPLTLYISLRFAPLLGNAPEARLSLGIAGIGLLVAGAIAGLSAQRLRTILASLTLSFCAVVFIHLSAWGSHAVSASLFLVLTETFGCSALLLISQSVSHGDKWLRLDDLGAATNGQPALIILFVVTLLALSAVLPSLPTLTLSQSFAADLAPRLNPAEITFTVVAYAIIVASLLSIARGLLKRTLASAPRPPGDVSIAPLIAITIPLVLLIVPGWYPIILEHLFTSAIAGRSEASVSPGQIWPQGVAIAFAVLAFAVGGLLFWLDRPVKWVLERCARVLPRRPERLWRGALDCLVTAGRIAAAGTIKIGYRPVAFVLAALTCFMFAWLAIALSHVFRLPVASGLAPAGAAAICGAIASLIAISQPSCERFAVILPIALLLGAIALLSEGAVDLSYLLILLLTIQTAIFFVLPARKIETNESFKYASIARAARIGLALAGGAGAALTGLAVANVSLIPTNWTRLDQIELWASILVLTLVSGVIATDIVQRRG